MELSPEDKLGVLRFLADLETTYEIERQRTAIGHVVAIIDTETMEIDIHGPFDDVADAMAYAEKREKSFAETLSPGELPLIGKVLPLFAPVI